MFDILYFYNKGNSYLLQQILLYYAIALILLSC